MGLVWGFVVGLVWFVWVFCFVKMTRGGVCRKQITAFCSLFVSCQVSLTGFYNTMLPYSRVGNTAKQSLILTAKLFSLKVSFYAQIGQTWLQQDPEFTLI